MNKTIEMIIRGRLKSELAKLDDRQIHMFKRMYSHLNLDLPIDQVVDAMDVSKLDWAMTQVERTIANNERKKGQST